MNTPQTLNGMRVIIKNPTPIFKHVHRFKKHRTKRNWTPRVFTFSHYANLLEDGQVLIDRVNGILYMNEATCIVARKAIAEAEGGL